VIKDILKTLVYRLCRYRTASSALFRGVLDPRALSRAQSQSNDQDSLPPYEFSIHHSAYMEND